jgi:hypothetical protein
MARRVVPLKKAKRIEQFAKIITLLDPDKITDAGIYILSQIIRDYLIFAKESELIRADIEAFLVAWLAKKQKKSPFPSENLLDDITNDRPRPYEAGDE